ncbi:type IV pilus assembly protein PilP [Acidovorax delafieldii]|uniref:Type IV pilus assembly protein PilP n=1 Tax=Acidovorax delafieldii TaxID=47920 RepID=A0AAJ2BVD5_ACIDE|nr:pilus assembly protein PilP [Acidovorax delafieldii]MDR6766633.1 type IV pilus assembly protein PilP [Acidovorax delafieldii]MDR6836429.1 type IV pilus assembly protein PilP [Acidovorax delafieldii]MDR7365920.1 type IV pilus assembly protein PilP [Acidovorax delafieldii]
MTNRVRLILASSSMILAGCGPSGVDELRVWMAEQRASTRPNVQPLTEPKKFLPEAYTQEGAVEPFNPVKLTQALKRDSNQVASNAALIAPEMARRKEPLEAFPLDSMAMVGSLNKSGAPTALVKVDNLIYQVKIGNYLGQNYGKVIRITESSIQLREIAQDATGDWIERSASLDLQEGKK